MKRRSFLRSAAATIPAALTQPFALALEPTPQLKEAHLVPAGQDLEGEPRTLGYSRLSFKTSPQETNGNVFIIEHANLLPGGPPLHLHLAQEEWFYVMEGEVLFQVGEKRLTLKPGESVLAPRLVPHAFSGATPKPAKMLIAFTPAGKMEQFFREYLRRAAQGNANLMDADLFVRHDMKLIGPPIKTT
jgi:mannose-6-phosphate isomerase-like protein (cupin superfamily)